MRFMQIESVLPTKIRSELAKNWFSVALLRSVLVEYDMGKAIYEVRLKKKNTCVSTNMPKNIRVGSSENLFIFCLNFCLLEKIKKVYWG